MPQLDRKRGEGRIANLHDKANVVSLPAINVPIDEPKKDDRIGGVVRYRDMPHRSVRTLREKGFSGSCHFSILCDLWQFFQFSEVPKYFLKNSLSVAGIVGLNLEGGHAPCADSLATAADYGSYFPYAL